MIMDIWEKHVYNDCAAFVGETFEHSENEPTISLGQRESYTVMKALEFQEKHENPLLAIDPENGKVGIMPCATETNKEIGRLERKIKLFSGERTATYKVLKKYGLTTDGMCLDTIVEDALISLGGKCEPS